MFTIGLFVSICVVSPALTYLDGVLTGEFTADQWSKAWLFVWRDSWWMPVITLLLDLSLWILS